MERIKVYNVIIEVTRRCNLYCEHCMRGKTQNKDIPNEYIDSLFSKINYISTLTISGGEPSLAIDKINYIIESAKRHEVSIGNFYIVTNGQSITNEFLLAIMNLYCYCSENEISQLQWSDSPWHKSIPDESIKKLEVFNFTSPKGMKGTNHLINQGRARGLNAIVKRTMGVDIYEIDEESISQGDIYLNCKGNIIAGCDFSYRSQDNESNIICHVNEFSLDKVGEFIEFQLTKEFNEK